MSPPINIDGSSVSSVTIDGTSVSEVTVDGEAVFSVDRGLLHHYEADNLSLNDGDSVSTWPDQAGSDDLTAGNAPTYVASAINGQPAVSYDFSDYLSVSFSTISTPLQHFLIAKLDSDDEASVFLYDGGKNFENSVGCDSGSLLVVDVNSSFITGGTSDTNWHQWDALVTTDDHELSIDGTEVLNAPDGGVDQTGITHTAVSGRSNTFNDTDAQIAAHLVYNPSVRGFNETAVRDYLTNKYGPF